MLDWFRDRLKPAEIRRDERITAYIDGQLPQQQADRLERELRLDERLQREVDGLRLLKSEIGRLPQQRVPRNFTLDPAVYGKPAPARAVGSYGALRLATAMAAVMFIFMMTLSLLSPLGGMADSDAIADEGQIAVMQEAPVEADAAVMQEPLALTAVVEEVAEEESAAESFAIEALPAATEAAGAEMASDTAAVAADDVDGEVAADTAEVAADDAEPADELAADDGNEAANASAPVDAQRSLKDPPAQESVAVEATDMVAAAPVARGEDNTVDLPPAAPQQIVVAEESGLPLRTVLTVGSGLLFLLLLTLLLLSRRSRYD